MVEGSEPAGVEAFVAEPPVEALDVAVLHWAAGLDVDQRYAVVFSPGQHASGSELRTVVRAHRVGSATLRDQPLQHARHAA